MVRSEKSHTLSMPKRHRTRRVNSSRRGTVSPRSDAVSHLFRTHKAHEWNRRQVTPLGSVALGSFLASLARCGFDGRVDTTRFCTSRKSQRWATKNTTPSFAKRGRRWDVLQNKSMASSAGVELNLTKRKSKNRWMSSSKRFWRSQLISDASTLVLPCEEPARRNTKTNKL